MSNIRVDLESVQVLEGQGASEGDFELRVHVQEGSNQVVWPSLSSNAKVDNNGAPFTINREVATYHLNGGNLQKRFTVDVIEVDKGLNGQDDYGQGTITFDLNQDMAPATQFADIGLKRPSAGVRGKVRVAMTAQRV